MIRLGIGLIVLVTVAHPALAQRGSRLWQPHERVVITDFSTVQAVAATDVVLYVVTTGGIGVYDRRFNRWESPVTRLDGFGTIRARAALVDPIDESLWIAADIGLVHYQPRLRVFETIQVPGGVRAIAVDERDAFAGLYVRTSRSWEFLPRGGVGTRPARQLPPLGRQRRTVTENELEERYPFLSTMKLRALTDDRLRRYRFTSATEVSVTNELFFGTDGYGVIRVDLLTGTFERIPFGLLAATANSVLVGEDGVWVGSGAGATRSGLTFVSSDLQRYTYEEGPAVTGLGSVSFRDMIRRGREVWAATDAGLLRVDSRGVVNRLTTSEGLGSERTHALAEGNTGVWVGTRLGLAFVSDDGLVERLGESGPIAVNALASHGDTVWVGSRQGLGVSWVGTPRIIVPPDVREVPELGDEIIAVTYSDAVLVVATRDVIAWRTAAGEWEVDGVAHLHLGDLTALAPDSSGVWVAGDRGIALFRFGPRDQVVFNTPGDFPGPIHDLVSDGSYLWVATDGGLVRFTRATVVP